MKNNNEEAINPANNKRSNKGIIITIIVVSVVIVGSIFTFGILYFQPKSELDKCLESAYALPETADVKSYWGSDKSRTIYPRKEAIDKCY